MDMKNYYLILLALFLNLTVVSQITFEKGYFINFEGEKVDCLIENQDWAYNPTRFEYMFSEETEVFNASIDSVSEFGIESLGRFIRFKVNIDTSSVDVRDLSLNRNPEFQEKTVFLKILVEGSADLFLYDMGHTKKYFYRINSSIASKVEPLIFKKYEKYNVDELEKKAIRIFENNYFRQQLFLNLKCADIEEKDFKTLSYSKKPFIKLFNKYNSCKNANYLPVETNVKRDLFNLGLRVGMSRSQFSFKIDEDYLGYLTYEPDWIDFDAQWNIRLGLEFELILPFNKNKWALFTEPTIHKFEGEVKTENNLPSPIDNAKIEYNSIEIPIGIRHYFYINATSKIFINGAFILDYNKGSKVSFKKANALEFEMRNNFALGLGYNYNDDFIFEFRYQSPRNTLSHYEYWESKYNLYSIIIGYSLF